jgi:NADH-quinone oxidoreductase subunit C
MPEGEGVPALPGWVEAVRLAVAEGLLGLAGLPGTEPADVPTLTFAPGAWAEGVAQVRAQGFTVFVDLTAVDYPDRARRFDVVLHLRHQGTGALLRCRTEVAEGESLPSLEPLFPGAGWPEREVYDLFGVRFEGNGDFRRLLLPEDWVGHPLRRDYPLQGPRVLDPSSPYAI